MAKLPIAEAGKAVEIGKRRWRRRKRRGVSGRRRGCVGVRGGLVVVGAAQGGIGLARCVAKSALIPHQVAPQLRTLPTAKY